MRTNMIIIDDFYSNPNEVREFALQQQFNIKGNYPGARTLPLLNASTKAGLSSILFQSSGTVTSWGDDLYTGCFQVCTTADKTWIHTDAYNTWSGVLFLTPDAPLTSGTSFYQHQRTGHRTDKGEKYEPNDYAKWVTTDTVGNVFNRLVLFRGDLWHAATKYFGTDKDTGRLIQTFFITTQR